MLFQQALSEWESHAIWYNNNIHIMHTLPVDILWARLDALDEFLDRVRDECPRFLYQDGVQIQDRTELEHRIVLVMRVIGEFIAKFYN